MKKLNVKHLVFLAVVLILLSGCAGYSASYNVVGSERFRYEDMSEYVLVDIPVTNGGANRFGFLNIPFLKSNKKFIDPAHEVDVALRDIPGSVAMVDVQYRYRSFNIPIIFKSANFKISSSKILVDPVIFGSVGEQ